MRYRGAWRARSSSTDQVRYYTGCANETVAGFWQPARRCRNWNNASGPGFVDQEIAHGVAACIPCDEGLAYGARQNQRELAGAHLLVLGHDVEEGGGLRRLPPRNVGDARRQPVRRKMRLDAPDAVVADQSETLRVAQCQADADGYGFAVQEPVGESRPRL